MPRAATLIVLFLLLFTVSCNRSSEYYVTRGEAFFQAGKYDDAQIAYGKAIQKNNQNGEAYFRMGLTELKRGRAADAYRAISRASDLLPRREDIANQAAEIILPAYMSDRNRPKRLYDDLMKYSDRMLEVNKTSFDGLRIKGYLALADRKVADAIKLFETANSIKPGQPGLITILAQILIENGREAEGEKLLLDLISHEKTYGPAYDLLYIRYTGLHRKDEAERILKEKVQNNPTNSAFAIQLARQYFASNQVQPMNEVIQRLLADPKTFPDARLQVGDFYVEHRKLDEALKLFEEGSKANPKQRTTYLKRMAGVWLAQGKGEQAGTLMTEVLKEDPQDETAKGVQASLRLADGKPGSADAAAADFQKLVDANPKQPVWRFNLGRSLVAAGKADAGLAQFKEAIKLAPASVEPRLAVIEIEQRKGDYAASLVEAEDLLKVRPDFLPAQLLRINAFMAMKNLSGARTELTRLEHLDPKNGEIQFLFGTLELTEKRFDLAETRFLKLHRTYPDNIRALGGLVEVYVSTKRFDRAENLLNASLDTESGDAVRLMLADLYFRQTKYDAAIQQYQELLKKQPGAADLHARIAVAYQGKGDGGAALASFRKAKEIKPNDLAANVALAQSLLLNGQKKEAIATYRHALEVNSNDVISMNNLASLLVEEGGNLEEAESLTRRALAKYPTQPNIKDTLGTIYLKKNLDDSALSLFRGLAQEFPQNPTFRYHHGLALLRKHDTTNARQEFEAALRFKPDPALSAEINTALAGIAK